MGFIERGLADFARTSGAGEIVSALLADHDGTLTDDDDSALIAEIMRGAVGAVCAGADVELSLTVEWGTDL